MALEYPNRIAAACSIDADDGGGLSQFFRNQGFTSVVRNRAGDYTLTLDQEIDSLESLVFATPLSGGTPGFAMFQITRPDDATINILTGSGGQAADFDFGLMVLALPSVDP